jgi:hypothetical protein
MPNRIVTSTYRYKRPPRKKKPVLIEVPAIVRKGAAKPETPPAPSNDDRKPAIVTITENGPAAVADGSEITPSANVSPRSRPVADAPRPAIVTVKRRRSRFGDVPDMALEEYQRRGEAADALFREIVRRATE